MSSLAGLLMLGFVALAAGDAAGCMSASAGLDVCANPMLGCVKGSPCLSALATVSTQCTGVTGSPDVTVPAATMLQQVANFTAACSFINDPCISAIMAFGAGGCSDNLCAANCGTLQNPVVSQCGSSWTMPALPYMMNAMGNTMNSTSIATMAAMLKTQSCVVLTGSISVTGISATDINSNATLKAAVASGIATAVDVPASYVSIISVSRRLAEQRQLAATQVAYSISIPPSSTVTPDTVAATLGSNTIADSLKSSIQNSLASSGQSVTLTVAAVTVVTTTTTTAAATMKASEAAVVKFGLPLVFVAISVL